MTGSDSGTVIHSEPERPAETAHLQTLVMAFPQPRALPLPASGEVVGRQWLVDAGIEDSEVSGKHLRFSRAGGVVRVEDVGSSNGTWVSGQQLPAGRKVPLDEGAILRIGKTLLVYRGRFRGELEPAEPIADLVGPFGLRDVRRAIDGLRNTDPSNVLIEGETGTGKELAARAVAAALERAEPYAAVNVAGVAAGVFESQLFGHAKGAFSDAREASRGLVLAHEGGTVFLDEIGELPLALQPKLLRLLENREVLPVGSERARQADVLLIAATNRALEQMVDAGEFRQDLWARLAMARIQLPPLRERSEDIFPIAQALAQRKGRQLGAATVEVEAMERLLLHEWRNNVRELAALIDSTAALDPKPGLRLWSIEEVLGPPPQGSPILTDETVRAALAASDGNESEAARRLGVTRGRLRRFLSKR